MKFIERVEEARKDANVGSILYTHREGVVRCAMFDYFDSESDEPVWHQRWTAHKEQEVQHILRRYPELAETGVCRLY